MPTPINLVDAIAERIEGIVGLYQFAESDGDHNERAPRVFRQYLPEKKYEGDTDPADYPFVVVALGDVEVAQTSEAGGYPQAQILISCGGYDASPDYQGWRIPTEIATRIMVELQQCPEIGPFQLEPPMSLVYPDTQPAPQWLAFLYSGWRLPAVPRTFPSGVYEGSYRERPHKKEIF